MRRSFVLALLALVLVAPPLLAEVVISPGVTFMGFASPYITVESSLADLHSAKVFIGGDGIIVSFRIWPTTDKAWPVAEGIPAFIGLGMKSTWGDGMQLSGLYSEAGIKLWDSVEVSFSLENFGTKAKIGINLGLSFTLRLGDHG